MPSITQTSADIQHTICMLLIPMLGDKADDQTIGPDTVIMQQIDSLEAMELILGLEDMIEGFNMDDLAFDDFGPTIEAAANSIISVLK